MAVDECIMSELNDLSYELQSKLLKEGEIL